ncbi:MAG: saccharopine dehydrogenase family protein [Candidatus Aminicenantales bacterium]
MNQYLVLGAGKMGVVLARDLIESDEENRVTLADIDARHLRRARDFIRSRRLEIRQMNVEDKNQRKEIFRGKDVALSALLHRHSLLALDAAFQAGVHFVDLAGEYPLPRLEYDQKARSKGITLLSGMGVSPGITNVCVGRAVYLLDEAEKALIYVGGNPVRPRPPLKYRIVYAVDSLLNFYERKVTIFKNGKVMEVPPLTGVETISFGAPFDSMECFFTDGLSSLLYTMRGKIKEELWEKTIRHCGHSKEVQTLKDCGLFSTRPIRVHDQKVIPRDVLEVLLDSRMKLGRERDVTLMSVIVSGKKSGKPRTYVFEMIDPYDASKNYTSMARTTCFPASIAAQMILSGMIRKRGSLFPEQVFHARLFNPFMEELRKRGVEIAYRIES